VVGDAKVAALDLPGIPLPPPLLFMAGWAVGFLIQAIWPLHILPSRLAVVVGVGGWVFVALSFFLVMSAVLTFRSVGTSPNPLVPTRVLATSGPYRFSRNPMYIGLLLLSVGICLTKNALWPLLLLPGVLLVLRRKVIDREERYLEARFGREYVDYKARVPRWL
jgi:protein-S-isoprenylcysteine O-methyltransferase Ste14